MPSITYALCALVASLCTALLLSAWLRDRHRLLLWSGLCFAGFTANNILLVLDKLVYPDVDLAIYRSVIGFCAIVVLLYGLVWDAE